MPPIQAQRPFAARSEYVVRAPKADRQHDRLMSSDTTACTIVGTAQESEDTAQKCLDLRRVLRKDINILFTKKGH